MAAFTEQHVEIAFIHGDDLLRGPDDVTSGGRVEDAEDDGLVDRRSIAQGRAIPVGQEALIGELGRRVVVGRACRRHRSGGEQSCAKEQAEVEFGLLHNIKQLAIILVAKNISVH